MEWLQAGVLIATFVVWAAAVLAVLAILSMNREPAESIEALPNSSVKYPELANLYDVATKPLIRAEQS